MKPLLTNILALLGVGLCAYGLGSSSRDAELDRVRKQRDEVIELAKENLTIIRGYETKMEKCIAMLRAK